MFTEKDLVAPAIQVIRAHGGICDTGDLISGLKSALILDDDDNNLLPSGASIRFDQIARNLKSNKVLEEMGLCEYYRGGFMLTEKGMIIETAELNNITVRHFAPNTNLLTTQAAMIEYVKANSLTFDNSRKAADDIIKLFKRETSPRNDTERRETMAQVIENYLKE